MATVSGNLRITKHFTSQEHEEVEGAVAQRLDRRLSRYDEDQVELEISLKDRDSPQQKVTLELWIAASGDTRFVGTSDQADPITAARDAASDVQTQLDRFLTRREDSRHS